MRERRYHDRIDMDVKAVLRVNEYEDEINAVVSDISECGICFVVNKKDAESCMITGGSHIAFRFMDTYDVGKYEKSDTITGHAQVKYTRETKDSVFVGCTISSSQFSQYVFDRRIAEFAKKGFYYK